MNTLSKRAKVQVFILGAYGQNNLGDEALLQVFIEQFQGIHLVVNSAQAVLTAQRYDVTAVHTYGFLSALGTIRAILASDWFVFGGGSLLKEIEGNPFYRLLYFARIIGVLLLAKLGGRHSAMLGNGMGPLNYPLYKALSRISASLTEVICVRDNDSRELLRSIGVKREIFVTADPVFTLGIEENPPNAQSARLEISPTPSAAPYIVVIPRYSLNPDQCLAVAKVCDHLIETKQVEVVFIPFQSEYLGKFDDVIAIRSIKEQMHNADKSRIVQSDDIHTVLDLIRRSELVLSARLHGLIFAALTHTVTVAINYEVKIRSFMTELDQASACVELSDLQSGALQSVVDKSWDRRQEIGEQVRERVAVLVQKAKSNFEILRDHGFSTH